MKTQTNAAPAAGTDIKEMVPLTSLFDPDCESETLQDCLDHYFQHISAIRVLIGHNELHRKGSTRQTILLARRFNIPTSSRVESSKVMITRGILPIYFDLCAETGVTRIQMRSEVLHPDIKPREVVAFADDRNLDVQYEIDEKVLRTGDPSQSYSPLVDISMEWLDAGAVNIVADVADGGMNPVSQNHQQSINTGLADTLASASGLHAVMFAAPTIELQQILLSRFGDEVHICDVPFPDVDRVEQLRTKLSHSTSFTEEQIRFGGEGRFPSRGVIH